jgi:glycosyltransferase involved in cell wall biosynthesis
MKKISILWESPIRRIAMGENARQVYEEKYTRDRNYQLLIDIYERAMTFRD